MTIFLSERSFEVMTWGVGHRGLLLRTLHVDHEPRVEIWFKPAYAVCLSSMLEGVHITNPRDPERLARVGHQLGRDLKDWEHLYEIVTPATAGWVVAGSVSGRQDQGGFDAPPMFDGWEPREGVEELFRVNVR